MWAYHIHGIACQWGVNTPRGSHLSMGGCRFHVSGNTYLLTHFMQHRPS